MERRDAIRALAVGAAAAVATPAVLAATESAASASIPGGSNLQDVGVGIYVDASTANQMSGFTINPSGVSCAVGTFGLGATATSGPFSMLMYSVRIDSYVADHSIHTITATGRMRSITMLVAGAIAENVEHDFIAVASNNMGIGTDRFDVHFVTPFWTPGLTQPMATPSSLRPGWARFGGNVATGLFLLNPTSIGGVNV